MFDLNDHQDGESYVEFLMPSGDIIRRLIDPTIYTSAWDVIHGTMTYNELLHANEVVISVKDGRRIFKSRFRRTDKFHGLSQ
jgi:hypothetical protein